MKVQPVRLSNINFGYDKYLNRRLRDRLAENPRLDVNCTMGILNNTCNNLENRIRRLEHTKGGVYDNYQLINYLAEILIPIKSMLAGSVDRFYPDLNFTDKESDAYEAEFFSKDIDLTRIDDPDIKKAYSWRQEMNDLLLSKKVLASIEMDEKQDPQKGSNETIGKILGLMSRKDDEQFLEAYVAGKDAPKSLDDVCGLKDIREKLEKSIVAPIQDPELAKRRLEDYGIEMPHFILLYGPPGCGKTMMTEAIAAQTGCKMYMIDVSKFGSSYINESAKNLSAVFEAVEKEAKTSEKPIIVFMDEIDSILTKRMATNGADKEDNKVINKILTWINNLNGKNIVVIGATNMPSILDEAGKNRANAEFYVGLPNENEIIELLKKELSRFPMTKGLSENEEGLKELAKKLKGYSPRTIVSVISNAKETACDNQRELIASDIEGVLAVQSFERINEQQYKQPRRIPMGFNN